MMNVAFVSARLTEHQIPFCEAMVQLCDEFHFIQMMQTGDRWAGKGGTLYRKDYPYLVSYQEQTQQCRAILENADALIVSVPYQYVVKNELRNGTPMFVYLERFFKKKSDWKTRLKTVMGAVWHHRIYEKYKPILLCASGFCAHDAKMLGLYQNRCYQWGYFPPLFSYRLEDVCAEKQKNVIPHLLWVGRLIDWKHPDDAVMLAKHLQEKGIAFHLDIIGTGYMENELRAMVQTLGLNEQVSLLGAKSPEQVRGYMERANVFVSTSDFSEGWGAVVNEAMNSACAVVVSHAVGSAPFLIKNGQNGLIYLSGDIEALGENVQTLLQNPDLALQYGKAAYETIQNTWNADIAAKRLLALMKAIRDGERAPELFADGPCSKAENIEDEWYHS